MFHLDDDDIILLKEIQTDEKINYAETSRKTGIPSSTVYDKISRLKEEGIIKDVAAILDPKKVGFVITSFVGLDTKSEFYKEVAEKLTRIAGFIGIYGTTGQFDLLVKIRTTSLNALNDILNKIRSIKGIDDIRPTTVLEIFKETHIIPLESREHK